MAGLNSWHVLCFSLLASFTHSYSGQDRGCRLPGGWAGDWFESGVPGLVSIAATSSNTSIRHKGTCVMKIRHSDSQFIFRSQEEGNCYRCLSIHQKHANVLQYKESRCLLHYNPRTYQELCWTISVDQPLRTLFRVNTAATRCPIPGTFSFSYSRGHGLCSYPASSLHQCADKSQLVLSYQACVDIKGSQSHTEWAQCIGDWKEGSTYYFAAVLNSSHVSRHNREESYRCFVYQQRHNGYLLSQSAGANCNLYTATEGYRTMTLTKLREEEHSCQFPSWLTEHRRYHSLGGRTSYSTNPAATVLSIHQPKEAAAGGSKSTRLECISEKFVGNTTARFTVQSVQSCQEATFHCLQLWRRSPGPAPAVLELKLGRGAPNIEDACHEQIFFDESVPVRTLTAPHLPGAPCPLTGNFALNMVAAETGEATPAPCGGTARLTAGCDNPHSISFKQKSGDNCHQQVTEFSCHDSWQVEDHTSKKLFTIVSYKSSHSTSAKGCLVQTTSSTTVAGVEFQLQEECGAASRVIWAGEADNYGDCAPTALATANSSEGARAGGVLLLLLAWLHVLSAWKPCHMGFSS